MEQVFWINRSGPHDTPDNHLYIHCDVALVEIPVGHPDRRWYDLTYELFGPTRQYRDAPGARYAWTMIKGTWDALSRL